MESLELSPPPRKWRRIGLGVTLAVSALATGACGTLTGSSKPKVSTESTLPDRITVGVGSTTTGPTTSEAPTTTIVIPTTSEIDPTATEVITTDTIQVDAGTPATAPDSTAQAETPSSDFPEDDDEPSSTIAITTSTSPATAAPETTTTTAPAPATTAAETTSTTTTTAPPTSESTTTIATDTTTTTTSTAPESTTTTTAPPQPGLDGLMRFSTKDAAGNKVDFECVPALAKMNNPLLTLKTLYGLARLESGFSSNGWPIPGQTDYGYIAVNTAVSDPDFHDTAIEVFNQLHLPLDNDLQVPKCHQSNGAASPQNAESTTTATESTTTVAGDTTTSAAPTSEVSPTSAATSEAPAQPSTLNDCPEGVKDIAELPAGCMDLAQLALKDAGYYSIIDYQHEVGIQPKDQYDGIGPLTYGHLRHGDGLVIPINGDLKANYVEVDLNKQMSYYIDASGKVRLITHISSGSDRDYVYINKDTGEHGKGKAVTPRGIFKIRRKQGPDYFSHTLGGEPGSMAWALEFYPGVDIHSNQNVPTGYKRGISHGCLRYSRGKASDPNDDAVKLMRDMGLDIGSTVWVHD